jgi:hypothetical protein
MPGTLFPAPESNLVCTQKYVNSGGGGYMRMFLASIEPEPVAKAPSSMTPDP